MDSDDKPLLIHLDYCLTPTNRITNAAIVVNDGKIQAVGGFSAFVHTENYRVVRLADCYALPGLIDTHLYGAAGFDCMHADSNRNISEMSRLLATHGVTGFVPTTQSAEQQHLVDVVRSLSELCNTDLPGAMAVGLNIEGPYISLAKRGAHPQRHIRAIDLDEARMVIEAGNGSIKIWTFAPELRGSLELVALLKEHGIVASMGHTTANQEQVEEAVAAGALRCCHLYNGMEPLQQRKLGLAAISLINEDIWVELIPDNIHCSEGMIDLACRCKSKERIIAISNSTEAAGLPDGRYNLGEDTIYVRRGRATLEDGTIAGSTNFLDQNYRNMLKLKYLNHAEAAACFTLNAARSIGLTDRGEIKPGKRADVTIFDKDHQVRMTLVNGKIVYESQPTVELEPAHV